MKKISSIHCIRKIKICKDTNGAIYQGWGRSLDSDPTDAGLVLGEGLSWPHSSMGTGRPLLQGHIFRPNSHRAQGMSRVSTSRVWAISETGEQATPGKKGPWPGRLSPMRPVAILLIPDSERGDGLDAVGGEDVEGNVLDLGGPQSHEPRLGVLYVFSPQAQFFHS